MRQPIGGKELDLLTKEELREELRSAVEYYLSGYSREPIWTRPEGGVALQGGATAGVAEIYVVDPGYVFRLTRLLVTVNNATFGAPVATAGGIDVYRGSGSLQDSLDGTPFTTLPQVATWNRANGPTFRDGETIRVGITGAPANAQVFCRAGGFLEPLVEGLGDD